MNEPSKKRDSDATSPDAGQGSPIQAADLPNASTPQDVDAATDLWEDGHDGDGSVASETAGNGDGNGQSLIEDPHDRLALPVVEEQPRLPFTVVGLGASAGGLEAYTEFLQHMPSDSGMAFVLIQHLSPSRESMIAEILDRHTHMRVLQVEDKQPVEPNHVYVIRPGHTLTIKDGRLHLGESLLAPGHRRPVDDFFRSLAEEQQQRAIAVILSGMGSNGTAGAEAIKAVGGVCIAQDPDSAKFPSMPRHLIDSGLADFILQPKEIPNVLSRYASHPYARGDSSADAAARKDRQTLSEIVAVLRTRLRHDFGGYKKPTVVRRVHRRMGLLQLTDMKDYARILRQNPAEVSALADDLMIHVTGFFRDPEAWDALRERVLLPLVAEREDNGAIRGWVTACSSGEEAYTLAMLMLEVSEQVGKQFDIKVFATDTAERSLSMARAGIYPGGIESEVSPERLKRFFEKDDAQFRIKKEVRELVVFAPQNVLQDPPFSRLDVCTCRNLLIYLEPDMQRRVLKLLHFGLREGGVLMLGTSETTGNTDDMFTPIDKRARLFRRVGQTRHGSMDFPLPRPLTNLPADRTERSISRLPRATIAHVAQRVLLDQCTPAAVVIDRQGHIVYFHGNTDRFLDQPRGEPTRELMALARETVRPAVRQALQQATADGVPVVIRDGTYETPEGRYRIMVGIRSLEPAGYPSHFLVNFLDYPEPAPVARPADGNVGALNEELQRIRDELQSTIEELQTSNEEMKASQEEITSINEELQSSNEELETSKEELQSLNEELTTVNSQLQAKMDELERLSNDLASLLASTDIAVIFLDTQFRIRRYTPAIKPLMDLIPSDLGRPLSDMARKFDDPSIMSDVKSVLDRLVPVERTITSQAGRHYMRRALPYRTADNRIDGIVVTFVDITEQHLAVLAQNRAEEELRNKIELEREARAMAEAASSAKDDFLANVSHELRTPLSAILLWAKMLSKGPATPEQFGEGLSAIIKSADSQRELIEDLLDTTRIASGKLRLNLQEVLLLDVVRSAVDAVRPTAENKHLTINTDYGQDIGVVRIDADRIRQVVWNLLSNAVKFTPVGGEVVLSLRRKSDYVELRVSDTGKGIPRELLSIVFGRFGQIEPQEIGTRGGLGLGLAISRQLVELHGGTIEAHSDGDGDGSTFIVKLPLPKLANTHSAIATPATKVDMKGVRALLVEDDAPTRDALALVLRSAGMDVSAAADGKQALEIFRHHKPQVVVSDISMPEMDGHAVLREIRRIEADEKLPRARAVAFSALSRAADRKQSTASGFDHHVAKPVDPDELLVALQHLLSQV